MGSTAGTGGNSGGDRTRASFGHLAPTVVAEPPRRASRIRNTATSTPRLTPKVVPVARSVAPHDVACDDDRSADATASATTANATARPVLDVEAGPLRQRAAARAATRTSPLVRYALIAALVILVVAYAARKLGVVGGPQPTQAADPAATPAVVTPPTAVPAPPQQQPAAVAPIGKRDAAGPPARSAERRVVDVADGDVRMGAAIRRARERLALFWQHAGAPGPGESDFALKVALPTRAGSREHIWAEIVRRDGDRIVVRLSNAPVDVAGFTLGSLVTVGEAQITDWWFRRNGRIVGAETLRALLPTMPAAEAARYQAMLEPP